MSLLRYPEPSLSLPSLVIEDFGPEFRDVVKELIEIREDAATLGATSLALAAPQIGINLRVFVWSDVNGVGHVVVNPTITESDGSQWSPEGCLSFLGPFSTIKQQFFPGLEVQVRRAERIVVRSQDETGQAYEHECHGLLARMFQHETDHLDGKLIVDRLEAPRRKQALKHWDHIHRQTNLVLAGK